MIDGMIFKVLCTSMYERRQEQREDVCAKEGLRVVLPCTLVTKIRGVFQLLLVTVTGQLEWGGVALLHTHGRSLSAKVTRYQGTRIAQRSYEGPTRDSSGLEPVFQTHIYYLYTSIYE